MAYEARYTTNEDKENMQIKLDVKFDFSKDIKDTFFSRIFRKKYTHAEEIARRIQGDFLPAYFLENGFKYLWHFGIKHPCEIYQNKEKDLHLRVGSGKNRTRKGFWLTVIKNSPPCFSSKRHIQEKQNMIDLIALDYAIIIWKK